MSQEFTVGNKVIVPGDFMPESTIHHVPDEICEVISICEDEFYRQVKRDNGEILTICTDFLFNPN